VDHYNNVALALSAAFCNVLDELVATLLKDEIIAVTADIYFLLALSSA
jgi:hypothetical protein